MQKWCVSHLPAPVRRSDGWTLAMQATPTNALLQLSFKVITVC